MDYVFLTNAMKLHLSHINPLTCKITMTDTGYGSDFVLTKKQSNLALICKLLSVFCEYVWRKWPGIKEDHLNYWDKKWPRLPIDIMVLYSHIKIDDPSSRSID